MVTAAEKKAQQDAAAKDAGDGDPIEADVIHDEPADDVAGPAPTIEEERAALLNQLAQLDTRAAQQGGYKEIPTHFGTLLCGCHVKLVNANATQHHCDEHNLTVPFLNVYLIPEDVRDQLAQRV